MSAISFSLPSHSICETKQALVQMQQHVFQLVNLPDLNLDFCPDVLILDNKHYTYQGVEHGRAIYIFDNPRPLSQEYNPSNVTVEDLILADAGDTIDAEGMERREIDWNEENREAAGYVEIGSKVLPVDYGRVIKFYECTMCRYRTAILSRDVKTEDCIVAESQGSNPPCSICGSPTVRLLYPLERNDLVAVSRKDYGYVEKGSRVEVELKDLSLHVDAHNPAYPPCPRCENLAKVLSDLLENPPGFEGIKVGSDHFGNKYIDYGWQEAVRRVRTAMVPLSCGTITEKDQK